jgi:hypothetical protein
LAAVRFEDSLLEELRAAIRLERNAMDAWFEEDEQVSRTPGPAPGSTSSEPRHSGSRSTA